MNPYESPSAVSSHVNLTASAAGISVFRFATAGLISGAVSSISVSFTPLGLFVPPLAFGSALALARGSRVGAGAVLIAGSCAAWLTSLLAAGLAIGVEQLPPLRGFWPGFVSGAVGSLIILAAYYIPYQTPRITRNLLVGGSTGALVGGFCVAIAIYFSDRSSPSEPKAYFVIFPVWQMSVALTLAALERWDGSQAKQGAAPEHAGSG